MIEIMDEVMDLLGKKVDYNIYILDGIKYRLVGSHLSKKVCYYVQVDETMQ